MQTRDVNEPPRGALRRDRRRHAAPTGSAPVDPTGATTRLHVGWLFGEPEAPLVPAQDRSLHGGPTLLVVCTGNICRSPLGELLLRDLLAPLGVVAHSAGTHALVGAPMQADSQRIAVEHGASAAAAGAHRARQVTEAMLRDADLTLTMTRAQRTRVVETTPSALRRSFPIREFAALSAGVPEAELHQAAEGAVATIGLDTPRARLAGAVSTVSARRGLVPLGTAADDVVDPYRQSTEIYDESAKQLLPAIDEVARVLRAVLVPSQR